MKTLHKKPTATAVAIGVLLVFSKSFYMELVSRGIFNGTDENVFSPDWQMTRGMFVTVIGRMAEVDASKYKQTAFSDVEVQGYYAPYVAWAQGNGIVSGVGSDLFAPNEDVTREQMAVIIHKSAEFIGADTLAFDTQSVTDSYTMEISALKESSDQASMTDQFLTEPALITERDGKYIITVVMHGTDFITMDMLKELKIQGADGEFTEVDKVLDTDANTLTVTITVSSLDEAVLMQTYAPAGMGEIRPSFRVLFDQSTKQPIVSEAEEFADDKSISDWAREAMYAMKNAGFISGKGDGMFDPSGSATRAEAAKILSMIGGYVQ